MSINFLIMLKDERFLWFLQASLAIFQYFVFSWSHLSVFLLFSWITYKLSSTWSCQWLNGSSSFLNMCTVWRLISPDKLYSYYKTKLGLKLKTFYEEFFNWTRWPSFSKITKNIKALDPFLGILEYISLVKLGNDDFHSFCKQAYFLL